MTTGELILAGLLTLAGITMSALCSGIETGTYTVNRVRLAVRAGRGERSAQRLSRELQHPERVLTTILIGNNIANYAGSFGLAAIIGSMHLPEWQAVALNALVLTPVLFVFGETLPKDLFRTHTDQWTYRLTPLLVGMRRLFTLAGLLPLVERFGRLVTRVAGGGDRMPVAARERMSQLIQEGAGAGALSEVQATLADRALALRELTVAGEMIPWSDVRTIRVDASPAEREAMIRRLPHTRLPVVNARGEVVGILNTLDACLDRERPTERLMYPPYTLPANARITQALRAIRAARRNMAIVLDPRTSRPVGIVTLKDLVEPVIGELGAW